VDRLYLHQRYGALGAVMGGKLDLYRVFAERMLRLLGPEGAIGTLVPSAFHANEGATGVRRLYLEQTRLERCLSFENRRKLFDIHASFKFALLVARRPGPTQSVRCGFYLTEFDQIAEPDRLMDYDIGFIRASGGPYETLLELRDCTDVALARRMFSIHSQFGTWMHDIGITLSREIHMSDDASKFTLLDRVLRRQTHRCADDLLADGYLLLHEGKTIHQFTDHWDTAPKYAIRLDALSGKPQTLESTLYYRAACREVASSTNERTAIAAILPPGMICGHTISVERRPAGRPNAAALSLVGLMNSFPFDWLLRQKAAAHVSLYILAELPVPQLSPEADRFVAHGCLRLCCNHRGFSALWREQLGDAWDERAARRSWPVVADASRRWHLRATMDAVIAHAYGLNRAQYERILGSFSHKSCASAPALCLAAFDELASVGPAAFVRKHDPYCEIRLVPAVARPVICLATTAAPQRRLALANPSI
jgi:hypothetical protein